MSYSYQFRLKIIKLVTEQDFGIWEVAKFLVLKSFIGKAFRERGLDGVKSPYTNLKPPKFWNPKWKKRRLKWLETSDFSPQAFKKLKREPALAKEEIDYLKKLVELDNQKRRQKKEKSSKS